MLAIIAGIKERSDHKYRDCRSETATQDRNCVRGVGRRRGLREDCGDERQGKLSFEAQFHLLLHYITIVNG